MVVLGSAAAIYAVLVLVLYTQQDSVLFPGATWGRGATLPNVQGVEIEHLTLPDGTRIRCAACAPEKPRGLLLFFVGNGEDLRSGMNWAGEWAVRGLAAVVPEYPGYGDSEGSPSHDSLIAAAETAAAFAADRAKQLGVPLFVGGSSLGTFCATHVAAAGYGERVLLLAPPTSVGDMGAHKFPWLPVRMLNRNPFDNVTAAGKVRIPALVLHGDADRIVPHDMGRRVAEAFAGSAEFLLAPGCGHTREPLYVHRARVDAFLQP